MCVFLITCFLLLLVTCVLFFLLIFSFLIHFSCIFSFRIAPLRFQTGCRRRRLNLDYSVFGGSILRCCIFVLNALQLVDLVMIGLVLCLPKFMVYYGFSPGFIFNYLSTGQEIGWKERLRYDLYCVEWDVKPQLNQSNQSLVKWTLKFKLLYPRNYVSYFNKICSICCVNTHIQSLKVRLKSILSWLKYSIFSRGLFFIGAPCICSMAVCLTDELCKNGWTHLFGGADLQVKKELCIKYGVVGVTWRIQLNSADCRWCHCYSNLF